MSCFSKVWEKDEEFSTLAQSIDTLGAPVGVIGLADINKVHAVHSLCEKTGKKAFIITPDEASAVRFFETAETDVSLLIKQQNARGGEQCV